MPSRPVGGNREAALARILALLPLLAAAGGPAADAAPETPATEETPAAGTTGSPAAPADERSRAEEARLQAVRAQIEALRARLSAGESEAGTVLDALDEIGLRIAILRREGTVLAVEIAHARAAESAAREAASAARLRSEAAERRLRAWMVEMYKNGPDLEARTVFLSDSPSTLAIAARAAETMARTQSDRLQDLRRERAGLEGSLRALEDTAARLQALEGERARREADLTSARAHKGEILDSLRKEQRTEREALDSLIQVERDLERLIGSLPGVPGGVPSRGLERAKGLLDWPVPGPVSIPFGTVHHPRFNTQVPHPGIEIACPPGETVRALYDGRVVYSAWFRGYGEMIVIDHGGEYLSIYGQLAERLVEAGGEVRKGDPIARSGGEGAFGSTGLYLEIRHQGKAEDPRSWLRRNETRGGSRGETRR